VFPSTEAMQAAGGYDAIIPAMLSKLSPILVGIVVVLVLSASMSTLSSLVMASSSTLTLDFIKGTLVKNMSEKKQLLIMRVFIAVFIAISVAIAIIQYKASLSFIAQLMGISWGALAGAFLGPFLYGLYWKRTSKASIWVCFGFSTVVMIANMVAKPLFPELLQSPIHCGVFCMVAGLLIVPIVSLFTKAPDQAHIEQVFSCYDKKVVVSASEAIGDPIQED
jgi:SSS family solute:Na+ symporter